MNHEPPPRTEKINPDSYDQIPIAPVSSPRYLSQSSLFSWIIRGPVFHTMSSSAMTLVQTSDQHGMVAALRRHADPSGGLERLLDSDSNDTWVLRDRHDL